MRVSSTGIRVEAGATKRHGSRGEQRLQGRSRWPDRWDRREERNGQGDAVHGMRQEWGVELMSVVQGWDVGLSRWGRGSVLGLAFCAVATLAGCGPAAREVAINGPRSLKVGDAEITVEIAATPAKRRDGYMFREEISEKEGMLFIFPQPTLQQFWMKNCLVPIDIAYIDDGFVITDLHTMQPPAPGQTTGFRHYRSSVPVRYVLEVQGGFFGRHGIEVGQKLDLTPALQHIRVLPRVPGR